MKLVFSLMLAAFTWVSGPAIAGEEPADNPKAVTVCEEPRPQVCTMDYRPVCGMHGDGSTKTYSNGCSACGNASVESWVEGECPE